MAALSLDARLSCVAALVRQGAVLADIGTDHAYLPLSLLEAGRISSAICSDVNEGPLARAKEHAALTPYMDRMRFRLCDGLADLSGEEMDDIVIAGMGGELIASILERAPFVRDARYRLILQPMTKQEHLRTYLDENGFSILREAYATAEGKHYLTLLVEYTGQVRTPTPLEALVGRFPFDASDASMCAYLDGKRRSLLSAIDGKRRGGVSSAEEEALLRSLDEFCSTK